MSTIEDLSKKVVVYSTFSLNDLYMYLGEHLYYLAQVIFTEGGSRRRSITMVSHIPGNSIDIDSLLNYASYNLLPFTHGHS